MEAWQWLKWIKDSKYRDWCYIMWWWYIYERANKIITSECLYFWNPPEEQLTGSKEQSLNNSSVTKEFVLND